MVAKYDFRPESSCSGQQFNSIPSGTAPEMPNLEMLQKDRTVHVGAKTRKAVKRYHIERGHVMAHHPLFASLRGGMRLSYSGLYQTIVRLRERAAVPNATVHAFRRTFAITCLRNGMNIYVLARLMGHADIQVLRKYLAFVEHDIEEAHRKHGPVDNL